MLTVAGPAVSRRGHGNRLPRKKNAPSLLLLLRLVNEVLNQQPSWAVGAGGWVTAAAEQVICRCVIRCKTFPRCCLTRRPNIPVIILHPEVAIMTGRVGLRPPPWKIPAAEELRCSCRELSYTFNLWKPTRCCRLWRNTQLLQKTN